MRLAVLFLISLVFCAGAHAQGSSHYNPYAGLRDGQWLLDLCDPPQNVSHSGERIETCMTYTLGIWDGYSATITAQIRREVGRTGRSSDVSLLCNERQMTLYELRMLVVEYLKAQPKRSNRAHHYVLAALQAAYPCTDKLEFRQPSR